MPCSREFAKGVSWTDRAWLSVRQLAAVAAFAALFGALVVWTTVAMPSPIAEFDVERLVPALAVSTGHGVKPDHPEAP